MGVAGADVLLSLIKQKQDLQGYRERHWTGTLADYMEVVMANPRVARNAYQRLYDMILSHGVTEYTRQHERYAHYRLFDDPVDSGRDAVFGLDAPLMRLVHNIKSAAFGYGTEKDRVGIGTCQPKDEKNQDSTELTGDLNYRKIAEYGSDSDPRAFNFDGELNIANRGIIEFIEILKLDVAFLYDLLGASQEHKIKPKKFPQTDIDEVICGHSVAGDTPITFRYDGQPGWTTLAGLYERFVDGPEGLEVLAHDFA